MRTHKFDQFLLAITLIVLADLTVAIGARFAVGLLLRLKRRGALK